MIEYYNDSLNQVVKAEYFIKILIWSINNEIEKIYRESLTDLKLKWGEKIKKIQHLKESFIKKTINPLNEGFFPDHDFFIHYFIPEYPCEYDEIMTALDSFESNFLKKMIMFYILYDLISVVEKKEAMRGLLEHFRDVLFWFIFIYFILKSISILIAIGKFQSLQDLLL